MHRWYLRRAQCGPLQSSQPNPTKLLAPDFSTAAAPLRTYHRTASSLTNGLVPRALAQSNPHTPRSSSHTDPEYFAMAAAIKALNAKIRSNKYTDYICSTRRFALYMFFTCGVTMEERKGRL